MLKFSKIVDESKGLCEVGLGTNADFYKSIGMILQEVEQGFDGNWYLQGYAPEKPQEQIEAEALAQAKAERADAVSKIIVTVDGMAFDGDEESQQRVARSIIALEDGETMPWVLYDNTIAEVTKEQLKQVLRLAGQKQSELWVVPYANK